ncbi:MAG: TraR/DksA family transcriptional regulator [Microthrixaceae bacterium]|nr:TraR/DksA family transcriptional regulator [Microthrixaceae bacterium]
MGTASKEETMVMDTPHAVRNETVAQVPAGSLPDDAIRARLLEARNALIGGLESRLAEVPTEPSGVSDGWGETEHLTLAEQAELTVHLDWMAQAALGEIEAAFERLDAGTYGYCVTCGDAIGAERLEALPAAAHCVNCQQHQEGSR